MALLFQSGMNAQIEVVLKDAVYFRIACQMLISAQAFSVCYPGSGKKVMLPFLQKIVSIFIL